MRLEILVSFLSQDNRKIGINCFYFFILFFHFRIVYRDFFIQFMIATSFSISDFEFFFMFYTYLFWRWMIIIVWCDKNTSCQKFGLCSLFKNQDSPLKYLTFDDVIRNVVNPVFLFYEQRLLSVTFYDLQRINF